LNHKINGASWQKSRREWGSDACLRAVPQQSAKAKGGDLDLDSEFSKRRTRYDVTLNQHEVADVLSASMRVATKRSQLLALVGLGLELLLRDRTIYADDAELLVALEAATDHHHAVHLITALHSAADVS
jgi:hypothetical protein